MSLLCLKEYSLLGHFQFGFTYYKISFEYLQLLGLGQQTVNLPFLKCVQTAFTLLCLTLPLGTAVLRSFQSWDILNYKSYDANIPSSVYITFIQVNVAIAVSTLLFLLFGLMRISKVIQSSSDLKKNEKVMCYQVVGFGIFCINYFFMDIASIIAYFNYSYP